MKSRKYFIFPAVIMFLFLSYFVFLSPETTGYFVGELSANVEEAAVVIPPSEGGNEIHAQTPDNESIDTFTDYGEVIAPDIVDDPANDFSFTFNGCENPLCIVAVGELSREQIGDEALFGVYGYEGEYLGAVAYNCQGGVIFTKIEFTVPDCGNLRTSLVYDDGSIIQTKPVCNNGKASVEFPGCNYLVVWKFKPLPLQLEYEGAVTSPVVNLMWGKVEPTPLDIWKLLVIIVFIGLSALAAYYVFSYKNSLLYHLQHQKL